MSMRQGTADMSRFATRRMTAPYKMAQVNTNLGNPTIQDQQGTTRQLFDSLPLDGRTYFEFFKDVSQHPDIPFSNLNQNKLQTGEAMIVRRFYLAVMTFDSQTGLLTDIVDIATAGVPELFGGTWNFMLDTQTIIKPNPLASLIPAFNKNSRHTENQWGWLDNDATIPTDIQFQFNVQVPVYTAVSDAQLRFTIEGFGSLLSLKQQV